MSRRVAVTAVAALSGLGNTLGEHSEAMDSGRTGLRPLAGLPQCGGEFADILGAWIEPRALMARSRWGPATNLCLELTRRLVADAQLGPDELADAWLVVGTSRGNAGGWIDPWPGRRFHGAMATSNSMHSEMAVAVTIEFGIRGPFYVLSNACASGLDALGAGFWLVGSGMAPRAIVLAADLPLLPTLLHSYRSSGLLSRDNVNDPYSPNTTGFLPAEGGAALLLAPEDGLTRDPMAWIAGYWANSDAYHPLGLPADGSGTLECIQRARDGLFGEHIVAVCPHASGTRAHGQAECRALSAAFADAVGPVTLHLVKPFTGHTIGASGALDAAIVVHYMSQGLLPPNRPGLTGCPGAPSMPVKPVAYSGGVVLKISIGMGGHNAVVALAGREWTQ